MSDSDYAYACQRAELLGQPKPSEEEWAATRKTVHVDDDPEEVDNAVAQVKHHLFLFLTFRDVFAGQKKIVILVFFLLLLFHSVSIFFVIP